MRRRRLELLTAVDRAVLTVDERADDGVGELEQHDRDDVPCDAGSVLACHQFGGRGSGCIGVS